LASVYLQGVLRTLRNYEALGDRGEAFAVVEALNRAAAHTAYHVGQIVLLAKHVAGANWKPLSIPKGQSAQHTRGQFKSGIIAEGQP
jgi:hypothetical protein